MKCSDIYIYDMFIYFLIHIHRYSFMYTFLHSHFWSLKIITLNAEYNLVHLE
jgi:hypothetical protein